MPDPDTPRRDLVLVLVHGATRNPAGFDPLIDALAHRGHRAFARSFTTARPPPPPSKPTSCPPTWTVPPCWPTRRLGCCCRPSPGASTRAHQVWVADYRGQRSLLAELQAGPEAAFNREWIGVDPTTDPVLAVYFLFHDADLAALRRGLETLQATDLCGVYSETPTEDPFRRPSTYLLPRGDRTMRLDWMARAARQRLGVEPVELDGAHNLYTASPELVADAITDGLAGPR